jgi:hypothetical protein
MTEDKLKNYAIKKVYDQTFNRNVSDIFFSKTPKNEKSNPKSVNDRNQNNLSFVDRKHNRSELNEQIYLQTNVKNVEKPNEVQDERFKKYAIKKVYDQTFNRNVSDIFFSKTPKNEKSNSRSVTNLNDNNLSFIERNVIIFSKRNILINPFMEG